MYHKEIVIAGLPVQLEIGAPQSNNPEHVANILVNVPGVIKTRGLIVYRKPGEYVLKMQSYETKAGDKVPFTEVSDELAQTIVQTVLEIPKDLYHSSYQEWTRTSIWKAVKDVDASPRR